MKLVACVLSLLLAACAGGTQPLPGDPSPGTDGLAQVGRWNLQGATDADGRAIVALQPHGKAVHAITFADGRVAIRGGCNGMSGDYRIDARGRLVVGQIVSTLMACADGSLMEADAAVGALLEGSAEWTVAESYPEQLHLRHDDGTQSSWVADRP